jgi:hypothetical protein
MQLGAVTVGESGATYCTVGGDRRPHAVPANTHSSTTGAGNRPPRQPVAAIEETKNTAASFSLRLSSCRHAEHPREARRGGHPMGTPLGRSAALVPPETTPHPQWIWARRGEELTREQPYQTDALSQRGTVTQAQGRRWRGARTGWHHRVAHTPLPSTARGLRATPTRDTPPRVLRRAPVSSTHVMLHERSLLPPPS